MDVAAATQLITHAQADLSAALLALDTPTPPTEDPYPDACQDREPRPKPTLPMLGPAGTRFQDGAFGTPMLRVTDETLGGSSWRVPSNAHLAAWNANATKFLVVGPGGTKVFAFDTTRAQMRVRAVADLPLPPRRDRIDAASRPPVIPDRRRAPRGLGGALHVPDRMAHAEATRRLVDGQPQGVAISDVVSQCEPCWSRRDPNVLYVVGGPLTRTLQAVTFDGDVIVHTEDILDLDTLGLHLVEPRTYVGGIVTSDDALTIFFGGTGQDQHCYVGQLPEGDTTLSVLFDTRPLGFLLHSAAVDLSGQFIALYPTNATPYQAVIVDVVTMIPAPLLLSPYGHDAMGYGWLVNADSGGQAWDAAQWQLRPLRDLAATRDLITPILTPKEIYFSEHTTWNHAQPDRLLPVISSTFRFNNEAAPWRAWDDEVIAIDTASAALSRVWRFCQHRSDSRDEANAASTYFWYQPIANVSPCGRWVLFTSNWEKTLGADPADPGRSRQDVFLVQLR